MVQLAVLEEGAIAQTPVCNEFNRKIFIGGVLVIKEIDKQTVT